MSHGCGMERISLVEELKLIRKAVGTAAFLLYDADGPLCLPTMFHSLLVFAATLDDGLQLATWFDVS